MAPKKTLTKAAEVPAKKQRTGNPHPHPAKVVSASVTPTPQATSPALPPASVAPVAPASVTPSSQATSTALTPAAAALVASASVTPSPQATSPALILAAATPVASAIVTPSPQANPPALPLAAQARIQKLVKLTSGLKNRRFFPDVPPEVCSMVAGIASSCLGIEHDARHDLQHKMLETVDEALATSKGMIVDALKTKQEWLETAESKKQELINVESKMRAGLEVKQAEVARAQENCKLAAEQLCAGEVAARQASAATAAARQAKAVCEEDEAKTIESYDKFVALDGASITEIQNTMVSLGPQLKLLPGMDDSHVIVLPSCMSKPDAERTSVESTAMIMIEGILAKQMRKHRQAVANSDEEVNHKEQAEIDSKSDVEKLKQNLASLGEILSCKQDECRNSEKEVITAINDLKEHEKKMGTDDAHTESTQALLAEFEEIEAMYKFLKGPQDDVNADTKALEKDSENLAAELIAAATPARA